MGQQQRRLGQQDPPRCSGIRLGLKTQFIGSPEWHTTHSRGETDLPISALLVLGGCASCMELLGRRLAEYTTLLSSVLSCLVFC